MNQKNKEIKYRICKYCGKKFIPKSHSQIYCKNPHYQVCPVCGKSVLVTNNDKLKFPPTACSYECRKVRMRETSLKRYGVSAPGNSKEAREKAKKTMIKKFGVPYAQMSSEIREKSKESLIKKYGVDNAGKSPEIIEKRMKTNIEKYGDVLPFNRPEAYAKLRKHLLEKYGVSTGFLTDKAIKSRIQNISKINVDFMEYLKSYGLECELEFPLHGKAYDIRLLNTNILIEIDPSYTHSPESRFANTARYDKNYQLNKTLHAEKYGYQCIHIFDWDRRFKLINLFKHDNIIYGRKCKIQKISKILANKFLANNDIVGVDNNSCINYGLFYDYDLIQVISFDYIDAMDQKYELSRLCTKFNHVVVGGSSKLFNFALDNNEIKDIISTCDRSKFTGEVYKYLNMDLISTKNPNKFWSKGAKYMTEKDRILNNVDESYLLKNYWLPMYDCGETLYEYKAK